MTIQCQTVQVMGSGQSAAVLQEYFDEPGIGNYYGETIDVILSLPEAPDIMVIGELQAAFGEIAPHKVLTIRYAHIQKQQVTDYQSFQNALSDLNSEVELKLSKPENHKFMVIMWTPYWSMNDAFASVAKIGRYIYAYAIMKNSNIPYQPGTSDRYGKVLHEIGHLLGLTGDNFIMDIPNLPRLSSESVMDYMDDNLKTFADDELKAITNIKFNNGLEMGVYLFGCRNGKKVAWYHKYQNTSTPHSEYSATWDEVLPLIDRINNGDTINTVVC